MEKVDWKEFADTHYEKEGLNNYRVVGDIPTTSESGESRPLKAFPRDVVYHYSAHPVEKYMKAPLLHVGSAEQAATVADDKWHRPAQGSYFYDGSTNHRGIPLVPTENPETTKFTFHPNAVFHPNVVSDEIINRAHQQVAEEQGIKVGRDIIGFNTSPSTETVINRKVAEVSDALRSGQIVPYVNLHEMSNVDEWPKGSDRNSMSYLVPNPKKNLVIE